MATVLVTRAEDDARETARHLARLGHQALISPLLAPRCLAWELPPEPVDAVMLTSARSVRYVSDQLGPIQHLPCFVVGGRTAQAARRARFADVRLLPDVSSGTSLLGAMAALPEPPRRLLHLAARERRPAPEAVGIEIVVREVYAVDLLDLAPGALGALSRGAVDWTLLYSARTATHFAACCARGGVDRSALAIAAISPAVLEAAGEGWRRGVAARSPHERALFACAGLLCENPDP